MRRGHASGALAFPAVVAAVAVAAAVTAATLAATLAASASAPPPPKEPTLMMALEAGFPRVKYPDGLVSLNDRCIVKANRLSTAIQPVYVNSLPIAFCCGGCPGVFSHDPEPYLKKQKIRVQCPVEPARPAVLATSTRCFVGHDLFYFSGASALGKFKRSPLTYATRLTDPVTRARFKPSASSPHLVRDGRTYYFQSAATRARFAARPDSFATRQGA